MPYKTISYKYELEYGEAEIEVHEDAIAPGANILIHDDLLATGGTALAAANIVKKKNAEVAAFSFLVVLEFLKGVSQLSAFSNNIKGIVHYTD